MWSFATASKETDPASESVTGYEEKYVVRRMRAADDEGGAWPQTGTPGSDVGTVSPRTESQAETRARAESPGQEGALCPQG